MHPSLDEWADWMRALGSSEATIRTRTSGIRTLCQHAHLDDPRRVTTRQLVSWLAAANTGWTRRTYWLSVHAWCAWLVLVGERPDDPSAPIPRPRQPHGVPRPVPEVVVRAVLSNPPGRRAYAYIVLASYAGLRVHEIAKVRGEDVDGDWLFVQGKGGQGAAVPMHPLVMSLARQMPSVSYWFPGSHGGHVAADSVSRVVRNAFKSVGSEATAHRCRHLFGTGVLRASRDIRVTQVLLRHQSLGSTQIYTEVTDADLVAAVHALSWVA